MNNIKIKLYAKYKTLACNNGNYALPKKQTH